VSFVERDLSQSPVGEVRAKTPLEVRLVEDRADVHRLKDFFNEIGRSAEEVESRLGRGDRCFIGVSAGRLVHMSWLTAGPVSCPEIKAVVRVSPGELHQGDF